MKNIIILIMAMIFTINANAQSFMTNTVETFTNVTSECSFSLHEQNDMRLAINAITDAYNTRICMESETSEFSKPYAFTNATLEHVLNTISGGTENHAFRYENKTKTLYVYPETNSLSMSKIGPIFIENASVNSLFGMKDLLGLRKSHGVFLSAYMGLSSWDETEITIDMDECFVWEVLDAICAQLQNACCWKIQKIKPKKYTPGQFVNYHITIFPTQAPSPPWNEKVQNDIIAKAEGRVKMRTPNYRNRIVAGQKILRRNDFDKSSEVSYVKNSLTNTVDVCVLKSYYIESAHLFADAISREFKTRICMEGPDKSISPEKWKIMNSPHEPITFTNAIYKYVNRNTKLYQISVTNAVLETMLDNYINITDNLTWRYENSTDSVYIYPVTNAFSTIRVEPGTFINATIFDIRRVLKNMELILFIREFRNGKMKNYHLDSKMYTYGKYSTKCQNNSQIVIHGKYNIMVT